MIWKNKQQRNLIYGKGIFANLQVADTLRLKAFLYILHVLPLRTIHAQHNSSFAVLPDKFLYSDSFHSSLSETRCGTFLFWDNRWFLTERSPGCYSALYVKSKKGGHKNIWRAEAHLFILPLDYFSCHPCLEVIPSNSGENHPHQILRNRHQTKCRMTAYGKTVALPFCEGVPAARLAIPAMPLPSQVRKGEWSQRSVPYHPVKIGGRGGEQRNNNILTLTIFS